MCDDPAKEPSATDWYRALPHLRAAVRMLKAARELDRAGRSYSREYDLACERLLDATEILTDHSMVEIIRRLEGAG